MNRERGFGIFEIIIVVVVIAALTAFGLAVNNWAYHHYVDPEKAKWDKEKEVYAANEKLCTEVNERLGKQFTALRAEVDGIAKSFEDAAKKQDAEYKSDLAKVQERAKSSAPKIAELRSRAANPSTNTDELARCRAAQKMLNEYATDVQKTREALGLVEIIGPTRVEAK